MLIKKDALSTSLVSGGLFAIAVGASLVYTLANNPRQTQFVNGAAVAGFSPFLWEKRDPNPPPVRKSYQNWPTPKRVQVSHGEGGGIGYAYGYTALDVEFAPYYEKGSILPILDIRGLYFDNNTWGANLGVICRFIPEEVPILPGLNVFYAYQQGRRANYNSLGVGLELLSTFWDFRFNGYIPLGQNRHFKKHDYKYPGGYFADSYDNEFVYSGFNAEVGFEFLRVKDFFLYAAGGPYYLSGPLNSKTWGVEGRLQPQYNDYVAVSLSVSNDNLFGTVFRAELILSLPLYNFSSMKNSSGPGGITNRKIYQPVKRFEASPLNSQCCWKTNF